MNECEVFMAALEIDSPGERGAYLDKVCGKDTPLRRRVDTLLDSHAKSGSLLEHPPVEAAATQFLVDTEKPAKSQPDQGRTAPGVDEVPLDFLEPSDEPDSLGRLGQYDVREVVGRGGMGIVLKAHDTKLSRVVAVKVLAPELAANATARKRFLREARAAAAVSHDHVVTIYAVEENEPPKDSPHATRGGPPYLVMEFIDGLSLEQKIDRDGHLELKEILRIGRQVAAGLAAAHGQGLIHRDIKPSNILLQNDVERVEITDFGLARATDDVGFTRTGEVAGTPQYMSPEQAEGKPVDARSDLFSLGSVLYAMCTGRSPFRAETTMASLKRVCEDTPRPMREINPDVPEWLAAITDRLLEKDPDDRFQSAEEVCHLLGECLAHVQDPAVNLLPASLPARGAAKRRRPSPKAARAPRGRRWAVAAALLIGALALVTLSEATGVTNLAATVIRIATGEGTLVIEVDDPTVQVSLDGEELTITGAGIQELTLRPGEYQFQAIKDGQPVKTELVTITRGGRQVVSVRLESPSITTIPSSQASAVVKSKQWETAIDNYSQVIELRPDDYEAWRERGKAHWFLGRWDKAIEDCSQAIKLRPDDIESYLWRSAAHRGKGDNAKAIEDCNSALRIDPKSTWALHNRAIAHRVWGHFNEALKDANRALQINPYHAGLLGERALSYVQLKQLDKALADCNEAILFDPKNPGLYLARGETYLELGKHDEALADCDKSGELRSDDKALPLIRAQILLMAGRTEEYRQACEEILDRFGQSEHVGEFCHAARACVLAPEAIPDPMVPVKLAARAVFRNPCHWCLYTFGMAQFRAGQLEEADQRFHESLNADPAWQARFLNWLGLALVHYARQETEESRKCLAKAVDLIEQNPGPTLQDRNEGQILRREVEQLLGMSAQDVRATAEKDAFVVLAGDGAEVAKFHTLAEAVVGSSVGDTIEIRGNGPFLSDPIEINHPLTIRAGNGFRPVIKDNPGLNGALLKATSALVLEGLELQAIGTKVDGDWSNLVESNAPLHVANCRLLLEKQQGNCIFGRTSGCLRNCESIASQLGLPFFWVFPSDGHFVIENCVLVGMTLCKDFGATGASLRLSGNTMMHHRLVHSTLGMELATLSDAQGEDLPFEPAVRVVASRNVVDSANNVFTLFQWPTLPRHLNLAEAEALLPRLVEWREEEQNLYRFSNGLLRIKKGHEYLGTTRGQDLADWNRFWDLTETGSSHGIIRYQGGDLYTKAESNPEQLTPEDFRLRPDSAGYRAGPDAKDLGADVDLVGPGEAYERWKKTPEYQEWQEETRKLMLAAAGESPLDYRAVPEGSITRVRRLRGHTNTITGVALSADGRRCLSGSADETMRLWDLEGAESPRVFAVGSFINRIALSPDGRIAACGDGKGTVTLWSVETAKRIGEIAAHEGGVLKIAFSADGTRLLTHSNGETLRIWNVDNGQELHWRHLSGYRWPSAGFVPGCGHVLVADETEVVRWDPEANEEIWSRDAPDEIYDLAVSPDGSLVATDSRCGPIQVWNAETGHQLGTLAGHHHPATLQFTSDSRHLVSGGAGGGYDTSLRVWSMETSAEVCRIEASRHFVTYVAPSPDGRFLVSGGGWFRDDQASSNYRGDDFDLHVWQMPQSVWTKAGPDVGSKAPADEGESGEETEQPERGSRDSKETTEERLGTSATED